MESDVRKLPVQTDTPFWDQVKDGPVTISLRCNVCGFRGPGLTATLRQDGDKTLIGVFCTDHGPL